MTFERFVCIAAAILGLNPHETYQMPFGWQSKIAGKLGINPKTITRWGKACHVPDAILPKLHEIWIGDITGSMTMAGKMAFHQIAESPVAYITDYDAEQVYRAMRLRALEELTR